MVSFVDHFLGVLTSVKLVDINMILRCASKQMTSVGESDFSAALDAYCLERFKAVFEHVHHPHSVCESDDDVESSWVECYTVCLVTEQLANLKLKLSRCLIVPNSHSFVNRAGGDQILLDANIHSLD